MQSMRTSFSKIAALVVVLTTSITVRANEVPDVHLTRQLTCLAQNIYYEAGTESFDGKVAVAQVTINRARSGKFPKTICGVINQKTVIADQTICQFSWKCKPLAYTHNTLWNECYRVAEAALVQGLRIEQLGEEALYFHNNKVNPNWHLVKVAQIGNHVFYSGDKVNLKSRHK